MVAVARVPVLVTVSDGVVSLLPAASIEPAQVAYQRMGVDLLLLRLEIPIKVAESPKSELCYSLFSFRIGNLRQSMS